jgi:signal transduction histidine kinase
MWSKTRSLSFKLTIFYIMSVLAIALGLIVYVEYHNYHSEVRDALRDAEVGPGFLNGAIPQDSDYLTIEGPEYALTAADIGNRLVRFKLYDELVEVVPDRASELPVTLEHKDFKLVHDDAVPGTIGVRPSVEGPVTFEYKDFKLVHDDAVPGTARVHASSEGPAAIGPKNYYYVTYQLADRSTGLEYEVGPIMLPESHFPMTLAGFSDLSSDRMSGLFYLPIYGRDDVVLVASLNAYTYPPMNLRHRIVDDVTRALPPILVFSVGFGFLISWLTTRPLKRITRATELLGLSDPGQRVESESGDEIGRLARSFNKMADRLEESFDSQRRFVSDAAHELRTPLASMKTSVTQALASDRSTSDYQELLGFFSGRIDHMEAMVDDLLFLSRVDEGKLKLGVGRLDLSGVLGESEDSFRHLLEDKGVAFSSEIDPGLNVRGDRKPMQRVISNLMDNAAKNTPSGGQVSLKAKRQDESMVVTLSDTGPGIPPEHLAHIFDRFYRVPGLAGSSSGHGLGLPICRSIILSSGGDVSVQSEPGKGTTFTIELPMFGGPAGE